MLSWQYQKYILIIMRGLHLQTANYAPVAIQNIHDIEI